VKVIEKYKLKTWADVEAVEEEVEILRRLDCPHIIKLYDNMVMMMMMMMTTTTMMMMMMMMMMVISECKLKTWADVEG
jgi:hypothetical protein